VAFYEEAGSHEPYSGAKERFKSFAEEERKPQVFWKDFSKAKKYFLDMISNGFPI